MRAIALLAILLFSTMASAQQVLRDSGPVPHGSADTAFPVAIGEFRRTHVLVYEADRSDMSANYSLPLEGGRMNASVYIYPSPRSSDRAAACRAEFEGIGQSITEFHPGARLVENGRAPPAGGSSPDLSLRSIHQVRLLFDDQQRDVRSESRLYCFVGGMWQVKYRVTASAPYSPEVLERFIAQGPWPGRAAAEPRTVAP
jgi:hypothetical protein